MYFIDREIEYFLDCGDCMGRTKNKDIAFASEEAGRNVDGPACPRKALLHKLHAK
jgi:hypothetical protein